MHVVNEREFTTDNTLRPLTVTLGVWGDNKFAQTVICDNNVVLFDSGLIEDFEKALDIYNHPALHLNYVSDIASRVAEYV